MQLTGRRRYRFTGNGGRVDSSYQYEFKCLDCGHVGWSRHGEIAARWQQLVEWFVEVVADDTGKVEKRMGPHAYKKAEKIESGLERNLDHNRYSTRIVHAPKA